MSVKATNADPALELLKEIKALDAAGANIPPMDNTNVRLLATHVSDTFQIIESMGTNPFVDPTDSFYRSALQYYRSKCLRGKRCLVAYLKWRMDRTTQAWWESQDNLALPQLSSAEAQYVKDNNELMVDYMSSFAVPLDLRAFRWRPPGAQNITVRGLKSCTFMSTTTGVTYHIEKGESHSMACEEAERLIQQGLVAEV